MTRIVFILVAAFAAAPTFGHGIAIRVEPIDGKLTIAGGIADPEGFARIYFADGSLDAVMTPVSSPVLGDILLIDQPGFEIHGLPVDSGLAIEPIARPPGVLPMADARLLWFWSPISEMVETAPQGLSLKILSQRSFGTLTLTQGDIATPSSLQIAEPLASDLGQHRHLLGYALDNSPPAAVGGYGFFARLTSGAYEASEPLLVMMNHGLSENQLMSAALAINLAAADPASGGGPGDFNGDGTVDPFDYDLWKAHFGQSVEPYTLGDGNGDGRVDAADYTIWRDNIKSVEVIGAASLSTPVPEPNTMIGVLVGLGLVAGLPVFRRARQARRWRREPRAATMRLATSLTRSPWPSIPSAE